MKAAQWVDRLKAVQGWESDYRAAKELGLSRNTISNWRIRPDSTMDDETSLRVAEALGEHPAIVLIDQAAERSKSERARFELGKALEAVRGKLRAAAMGRRLASGGGKAHVDITPVTSAGGDPSELHPNAHCVNQTAAPIWMQILANRSAAPQAFACART